jgi:hypothetical protein
MDLSILQHCEGEQVGPRSKGNLGQRLRQVIDVSLGAERPRADADRAVGEGAEGTMNVRRAMQPRADGNLERLIENGPQLRCWQ